MDYFEKMLDYSSQGFFCSQILMLLALEEEGGENPDLIRAMSGLNGGLGFCGKICGALTGGCCLIGYYTGKGEAEELESGDAQAMIRELVDWFEETVGPMYGGTDCAAILDGDPVNQMKRCPQIVEAVYGKAKEILHNYGVI
jgi:C_GCAxxG_C_C family probable redox protein